MRVDVHNVNDTQLKTHFDDVAKFEFNLNFWIGYSTSNLKYDEFNIPDTN